MVIKLKIINKSQTYLEDENCGRVRRVKYPQRIYQKGKSII